MPVPQPGPDTVELTPPTADEAATAARGVASAVAPSGELTEFQRILIESMWRAMTGHTVDLSSYAPMTAEEFARFMARRDLAFRSRMVQAMLTPALVLHPLPEDVADRIAAFARELGVDEAMVDIARRFAHGALGLAAFDFERNGYTATWEPEDAAALHTSAELASAWDVAVKDPGLAARWSSLEQLPAGSIGRRVWEMYRARGFVFPGLPGSAPPLLAQHDWVHVLADYGTTVGRSWRCLRSSPGPTTTCGRTRCWRWCCRCSRPATCAPAPACSDRTPVTSRKAAAWRFGSATRYDAACCAPTTRPATTASTTCASTGSTAHRCRSTTYGRGST